ncbi:hypothetical protein ZIOFF_009899 [Zingiber officinale]|uniref:Uncharacterized protein n=1 Tax=Zingiber officinale TaxID=94328 RepID=A0A8J5I4B0_ZINOF|nr:hypothetical protein ZIOFF_009899 [Zingiber officinale]
MIIGGDSLLLALVGVHKCFLGDMFRNCELIDVTKLFSFSVEFVVLVSSKSPAKVWFLGAGRRFPSSSGRASTRDADPLPTADFPSSSGHCFALLSLVAGHRVVPLCCALDFLVLPDSNQTVIQSVALEPLGLRQVLIFGYFDLGISYQRLRENDWHYCRYGRFGYVLFVWFLGAGRRFPSSSGRASTRDADPLPTADFPSSSGHCFALLSLVAGHRVVPLCCALDFLVLPDSNQTVIQSVALEPLGLRQVLIFGYFDLGISYQRLRENDWHYCRYGRFGYVLFVSYVMLVGSFLASDNIDFE